MIEIKEIIIMELQLFSGISKYLSGMKSEFFSYELFKKTCYNTHSKTKVTKNTVSE